MKIAVIAILVSTLAAECPATPPPMPAGDAAPPDAGSCALACTTLRSLGCKEGLADNCVPVCEHTQADHLVDLRPTCLGASTSKAAARACGSVECP